jgi:hypothetical protein
MELFPDIRSSGYQLADSQSEPLALGCSGLLLKRHGLGLRELELGVLDPVEIEW